MPPAPLTTLSLSEFERAFHRELARAERHDHTFSVVIFLPDDDDAEHRHQLEQIVLQRARTEDIIGYIDTDRVATLLPETDEWGAWRYADDILSQFARADLRCDCRVYTNTRDEVAREAVANGKGIDHDDRDRSGTGTGAAYGNGHSNGNGAEHEDVHAPATHGAAEEEAHPRVPGKAERPRAHTLPEDEEGERKLASVRWELGNRHVDSIADWLIEPLPTGKRAFDFVVSGLILTVLSPLLFLIALGIKLTSPGPVIFKQRRAGLGGEPFMFLKFRSMCTDAEERKAELEDMNEMNGPVFKIKNDPRITPFGRFLRKWSLDELPQLWNVFRGDMSLVGPRPPMMNEIPGYETWQRRRLRLTGGITCVWQVSGRNDIDFEDWMRMDMRYIRERSAWVDMKLLFQTVWTVVSGKGAY